VVQVRQPLPLPQGVEDSAVGGSGSPGYGMGGAGSGIGGMGTMRFMSAKARVRGAAVWPWQKQIKRTRGKPAETTPIVPKAQVQLKDVQAQGGHEAAVVVNGS